MRKRYTAHLTEITDKAPQLLICYDYDQSLMEGPPFSVSNDEIKRHYAVKYDVTLIANTDFSGGLKGKCSTLKPAEYLTAVTGTLRIGLVYSAFSKPACRDPYGVTITVEMFTEMFTVLGTLLSVPSLTISCTT